MEEGRTGVPLKDMHSFHSLNACLRISERHRRRFMQYQINAPAASSIPFETRNEEATYDGDEEQRQADDRPNERTNAVAGNRDNGGANALDYLGWSAGTQAGTAGGSVVRSASLCPLLCP